MKKKTAVFFDGGKRWKRIKKLAILGFLLGLFGLTVVIYSLYATPFNHKTQNPTKEALYKKIEAINDVSRPAINKGSFMTIEDIDNTSYIKRFGENKKLVVLTFDDGPDPHFTPRLLQALQKERVKGTFFTVGYQLFKYPKIGEMILKQGSDIGLHTFSHYENRVDKKLDALTFMKELDFTEKIFAHLYGYKTRLFRIPYVGIEDKLSYDALQYIREAYNRGLTISAPTVDSQDWSTTDPKKIVKNATESDVQTVVLLFHDAGGNRSGTIQALPEIVKFYRERGYQFITVSELAKRYNLAYREELTFQDSFISEITFYLYTVYKKGPLLLDKGFIIGFFLVIIHMGLFILLSFIQLLTSKYKEKKRKQMTKSRQEHPPLITVIIPMHNEEKSIQASIRSVLRSSYKNFKLLVVDDGSTDKSAKKVKSISDSRVELFRKEKGGKVSALNYGLKYAKGKYVICIDADTRVTTSAIGRILRCFDEKHVAAVAGNVQVGNKRNILTKLQAIEYILGQAIEKRAFELFRTVMVVPGAFGAWRTSAIRGGGGFPNHTHAEDFDLTMSLIKRKLQVRFCDNAIAYTEAPTSVKQLFMQRYRWNFGNLQVFFKYKHMLFRKRYGIFGLFFLPRALFLLIPSIILTPIVDLFILTNLFIGERELTLLFLLFYFLTHMVVIFIAYKTMKQPLSDLFYVPFLRFPYSQFMYMVFYGTLLQALKGEIVAWSKLSHTGKLRLAD